MLKRQERSFGRKEINDPLWGTISLSPIEVALLDSPLLQRLRFVRQLGVVHWVYPGAIHTRFEHSLGVLHQTQNLISALNSTADQIGYPTLIESNYSQLLRICALLHDIGHTAFSHVSEIAIKNIEGVDPITAEFAKERDIEQRQLSEIIAYYVIRSVPMKELLSTLIDNYENSLKFSESRDENINKIVEKISDAIIGIQINDKIPLLHEIISGPFDADKLDYFVRDARNAGTPSVLDISRLIQKISVVELSADELPEYIGKSVARIDSKYFLFGVKWSGIPVLDELHLARVLLYAKIYRHPKVIAIEQMLRSIIQNLACIVSVHSTLKLFYSHNDDALLTMSKEELIAVLGINSNDISPETEARLTKIIETLKNIRHRSLSIKALQIHRQYPSDPLEHDEQQQFGFIDFLEDIQHPQSRQRFHSELLDETSNLLKHLDHPPGISRIDLESSIMIHAMDQTPGGSQIARATLLPASGTPIPFREYTVNRASWAASYMTDQPNGFVFAPSHLADAVYIAAEKLLRTHHNVKLPCSAMDASKRNASKIQKLKREIALNGYYKKSPYDIRPMPERLQRADVARKIDAFSQIISIYQGPQNSNSTSNGIQAHSIKEHIEAWLRQFDNNDHIECALHLLERFKMIGRTDTVNALRNFIDNNEDFRGAVVVPFGDARDSGAIQTYFSADLSGSYISTSLTLPEAVKQNHNRIIFIDDFIGSGGQGTDILAAGFGIPDLRNLELEEQREMFDDDVKSHLRQANVAFVFTAAWDQGIDAIKLIAKNVGLNAKVNSYICENDIPFAFDKKPDGINEDVFDDFKKRCEEIGASLQASKFQSQSTQSEDDRQKIKDRSLGYGNKAMLLASPFNVPTQTLSAIWAEGEVDGVPWLPLLPRRKKK